MKLPFLNQDIDIKEVEPPGPGSVGWNNGAVGLNLLAKGSQLFINEHHRRINIDSVPFQLPRLFYRAEFVLTDIELDYFPLILSQSDSSPAQGNKVGTVEIEFVALNNFKFKLVTAPEIFLFSSSCDGRGFRWTSKTL